jgi:hypothetical protein
MVRQLDWRSDIETSKSQLNACRSFDGRDILPVQPADPLLQAKLAHRAQLIRHCLALLSPEPDIGFGQVEASDIAGQWHDRDAVEFPVCQIVASGNHIGRLARPHRDRGLAAIVICPALKPLSDRCARRSKDVA